MLEKSISGKANMNDMDNLLKKRKLDSSEDKLWLQLAEYVGLVNAYVLGWIFLAEVTLWTRILQAV